MNCHSQKLENSNVMVFEFCKKRIKSLHPSPHVFYLETCKGHLIDVRAPGCRNVVFYIVLKPYTRHKSCWRYSVQVSHRGQRSAGWWLSGGGLVPWQPICPSVLVSPGFWCFKCVFVIRPGMRAAHARLCRLCSVCAGDGRASGGR